MFIVLSEAYAIGRTSIRMLCLPTPRIECLTVRSIEIGLCCKIVCRRVELCQRSLKSKSVLDFR
jgi:hypothetical protein